MIARRRLYYQGVCWLLMLAPFFFLTYGQVNNFTAGRENIGNLVFRWEHLIPFIPSTIIPYWSLDLLYGISLFICTSLIEQRRLVCKLILASITACVGFLLFPLQFTFTRPEVSGLYGWFFCQLQQFDLPYNQSPSLHIILCWILWRHYDYHLDGIWKKINAFWFFIIAISVLTTWQHHFIDIITGLAVGMIIDWLIPQNKRKWRWRAVDEKHKKIAFYYFVGSLFCLLGAFFTPWLWWPMLSLFIVALAYALLGVDALQKDEKGQLTPTIWWLLLPWRMGMMLSKFLYTRRLPEINQVIDGIFFGIYPHRLPKQCAVLDLSSEFSRSRATRDVIYCCVPMLDLVNPDMETLSLAVNKLEQLHTIQGSVLVHCALGLSRSALIVTAWMLQRYPELETNDAISYVKKVRPQVVLTSEHTKMLVKWKNDMKT